MAHARRKFHELWANHRSQVGEQALKFFGQLYEVERAAADADSQARLEARQTARPLADALNQWLRQQRQRVPDGSATARAIDYSLKRWTALTRYLDDGDIAPFTAVMAPRAVPQEVVNKLIAANDAVLADATLRKRVEDIGGVPTHMAPAEFESFLRRQADTYAALIQSRLLKAE